MPYPCQTAFDFISGDPGDRGRPQRPERTFIGLFPDDLFRRKAKRIYREAAEEFGLVGSPLRAERYHTTMVHISDRKRLRSKDQYAADLAAAAVRMPPFDIVYTRLASFPGVPKKGRPLKHPLVLLADRGPVLDLYATLGATLQSCGFRIPGRFRPHLTLSYNLQFVPAHPIAPLSFVVRELLLIHSELGLGRYNILRSWPLH